MLKSFLLAALVGVCPALTRNSTIYNPILPGFHSDPSCIFVPELENTFFCVTSTFLAFPGLPIYASKDLQNWSLVSNVLNQPTQLPNLGKINAQTAGIWAPSIRYHRGKFYVSTTLVDGDKAINDSSRWDNVIFTTTNPYKSSSWSNPTHFKFDGYDPNLFFDEDDKVYIVGSHLWEVYPGIELSTINLKTGKTSKQVGIWNGTGGIAPEGPRIYKKDGFYYLLIAEGGTFTNHMVTIARSRSIWGPYESNPANPILTNANTTEYFQAVGHADLFQDARGAWWGAALAIRLDLAAASEPMGRETVLFPVIWGKGKWPVASQVRGTMSAWELPKSNSIGGVPASGPDDVEFSSGSQLPEHLVHWWFPEPSFYTVSPAERPNSMRLRPSTNNLTGSAGGGEPNTVTFLARRQMDSLFTYSIDIEFAPKDTGDEAGVAVFAETGEHIDFGITKLSSQSVDDTGIYFRLRGETQSSHKVNTFIAPVPTAWLGVELRLEIKAFNTTHYAFSAGPAAHAHAAENIAYAQQNMIRPIFTGALVGTYVTNNGQEGDTPAYISKWRYQGEGQFRD